jgi:hypothetical protein
MPILRIEHPVPDFEAWKKTFDSDPLDRKSSGVRRYRVMRPADDPNYATVDLEFDTMAEAEALLAALHRLWGRVQGEGLIGAPQARIIEVVESTEI